MKNMMMCNNATPRTIPVLGVVSVMLTVARN